MIASFLRRLRSVLLIMLTAVFLVWFAKNSGYAGASLDTEGGKVFAFVLLAGAAVLGWNLFRLWRPKQSHHPAYAPTNPSELHSMVLYYGRFEIGSEAPELELELRRQIAAEKASGLAFASTAHAHVCEGEIMVQLRNSIPANEVLWSGSIGQLMEAGELPPMESEIAFLRRTEPQVRAAIQGALQR